MYVTVRTTTGPDKPTENGSVVSSKCNNCLAEGHHNATCPQPKRSKGSCFGCGQMDHQVNDCPIKKTIKETALVGEGIPVVQRSMKNSHKKNKKIVSCFGCGQMDHLGNDCPLTKFKKETALVYEKRPVVQGSMKQSSSTPKCFNCLAIGHLSTTCTQHKRIKGSCFSCGQMDHQLNDCPIKSQRETVALMDEVWQSPQLMRTIGSCFVCGQIGHQLNDCPIKFQRETVALMNEVWQSPQPMRTIGSCFVCGQIGHQLNDCPIKFQRETVALMNEVSHSPQPMRTNGSCFGCGQIGHQLNDCPIKSQRETVALVDQIWQSPQPMRTNGSCFGCGQIGHQLNDCPIKSQRETVALVDQVWQSPNVAAMNIINQEMTAILDSNSGIPLLTEDRIRDNIGESTEVKSLSSISSTTNIGLPERNTLKRRPKSPNYVVDQDEADQSCSGSRRSRSKRSSHDDRYSQERRKAFSRDRTPDRRTSPSISDKSPERKIAKNEWQSVIDRNYRWDKYRAKLKKLEMKYDEKWKYYEDGPEKHPSYSEEWKNYWKKKYKEIEQTGHDPSNYDYIPEWKLFWVKRMKEIIVNEFEKKKEKLTKYIGVDGIRNKGPRSDLQEPSPTPDDAKDVTVNDIINTWKALTDSVISTPPDKEEKRSLSPYEKPNQKYNSASFPISTPVVNCLRMLSVLENQLGSLGPKVLDLLSQALALERSKEGDSMTMLEDRDNHIFFDTVKEKVRGQLLAGIVEKGLVNSCYTIIVDIENMLRTNPPEPKRHITKSPPVPKEVPVEISQPEQVHGIGMIDKMAVAQQIAGALVAQGKTDVTQEELVGLINAVVGIAQDSNVTVNQDTSTVDFFSQLNLKKSTANSHINELLGSMISTVQKTTVQAETPPPPNPEPVVLPPPPEPEPVVTEKEDNDEDLKEKLMNFSNLPRKKQQELIKMLKDLESTQPDRVKRLKKYGTIGLAKKSETKTNATKAQFPTANFEQDEEQVNSVPSDDDDYSFEDVYKPASEKLKTKEPSQKKNYNKDGNSRRSHLSTQKSIKNYNKDSKDDDDDYSFEDIYKPASRKLKTKEPSQKKNYNKDSNSRRSHLSTKMMAKHSGVLNVKDASQMSISSNRTIRLEDWFSKKPLARPPSPPMNSRLSLSDESNLAAFGQQNTPFRGERSNFGLPGGESNQFNQNYSQQIWNTEPPPVPQNQFVPGNQIFSLLNFNQPSQRNFGNYSGNY